MKSLNDWKQSYLRHTNVHAHKHSPEKQSLTSLLRNRVTQLWLSEKGHFLCLFLIDYSTDKGSDDSSQNSVSPISQEKQKQ